MRKILINIEINFKKRKSEGTNLNQKKKKKGKEAIGNLRRKKFFILRILEHSLQNYRRASHS